MNEMEQKPIEQTGEQVPETAPTMTAIEEQEGAEQQDVTAVEVSRPVAAPEAKKEVPKGARSYELIFLVDAGLPKEELDEVIGKVQTFLEQRDGVVDNVRVSDVRRLAYPIKKRTHGIYVVVNFWLKPNLIAELERMLRLEERVLRHMVIQTRG